MPIIKPGKVIKYIMGEDKYGIDSLENLIINADPFEFKLNVIMLEESLDSYFTIKESIARNKWKEGVAGGAIAGGLIVGLSAAISPITTLTGGAFRMFSGVIAGGTSALVYKEIDKNCNPELKRVARIKELLQVAKDKQEGLESQFLPKLA